ncbi:hypothetical protein ACFWM0_02485 [Streptomyces sp. NPDC058405]|uniref:hypothetical protein n=1 Tax=Streptomyces sp. NPDC058405 TaxID=3346482 RepID=UPI0036522EA1
MGSLRRLLSRWVVVAALLLGGTALAGAPAAQAAQAEQTVRAGQAVQATQQDGGSTTICVSVAAIPILKTMTRAPAPRARLVSRPLTSTRKADGDRDIMCVVSDPHADLKHSALPTV